MNADRDTRRARALVDELVDELARIVTRPWTVMEVCGGQTHTIVRSGLDQLLPAGVDLVHGPGCPVCVTPVGLVDAALDLARRPGVTLCSFGDMLRVPGTAGDLLLARAEGADVRAVYSPLDALERARAHPDRQVVFFAVGFETTAPTTALAVRRAEQLGLGNFSVLVAHVRVPPAVEAILTAPGNRVQGFLAAGHVCTVMGLGEYRPLVARHGVPIVATGFAPHEILAGLVRCLGLLEQGRAEVANAYDEAVAEQGNAAARALIESVYEPRDRVWRGLGTLPGGGLGLRDAYRHLDAERRFGLEADVLEPVGECIAGEILQGRARPASCPAFGTRCTPEHPLGAPMVSSEGACAAYYHHRAPTPGGMAGTGVAP